MVLRWRTTISYMMCDDEEYAKYLQLIKVLYYWYCAARSRMQAYVSAELLEEVLEIKELETTRHELPQHESGIVHWETWLQAGWSEYPHLPGIYDSLLKAT